MTSSVHHGAKLHISMAESADLHCVRKNLQKLCELHKRLKNYGCWKNTNTGAKESNRGVFFLTDRYKSQLLGYVQIP